jgi:hypothetical protein
MASYVMCLWLINPACGLADLISPQNDLASLESEIARARPRGASVASALSQQPEANPTARRPVQLAGNPAATNQAATVAAGLAALVSKAGLDSQ